MPSKVWGQAKAEPEEVQEERQEVAPAVDKVVQPGHVHDWTQISPRKRKCKPCGAVEIQE